jgi:hypothetical protein
MSYNAIPLLGGFGSGQLKKQFSVRVWGKCMVLMLLVLFGLSTASSVYANTPPEFLQSSIAPAEMYEGEQLERRIAIRDLDGDRVTLTAEPLESWMQLDRKTFTAFPGAGNSGVYNVVFTADDGTDVTTETLNITVYDPISPPNRPPEFGPLSDWIMTEGSTVQLDVPVSDPDGDTVTLSALNMPSWISLAGYNLTATPGPVDVGTYRVRLEASDGVLTAELVFDVVVAEKNFPPEMDPIADQTVLEGNPLSVSITATDPDGDEVVITLDSAPNFVSIQNDVLLATPQAGDVGTYEISVSATDGVLRDNETFTLTVLSVPTGGEQHPWTAFVGSQREDRPWAGWVRGPNQAITVLTAMNKPKLFDQLKADISQYVALRDVMIPAGFEMTRMLDLYAGGQGNSWVNTIHDLVGAIAQVDPEGGHVTIQLGNEITKLSTSAEVRDWAAANGTMLPGDPQVRDPEVIPYYVEYYFAPSAEAIMQASLDYYGDAERLPIVLGSIGNSWNRESIAWLGELLSYQIEGQYAPSLAGVQVSDLVDIITLHYAGNVDKSLQIIWDLWVGQGSVKAIWTTEEGGRKAGLAGFGATKGLVSLARHLDWYCSTGRTPDQTRVNFFAWWESNGIPTTTTETALDAFLAFFGAEPLKRIDVSTTQVVGTNLPESDTFETYGFRSQTVSGLQAVISKISEGSGAVVEEIVIPKAGWTGAVSGQVTAFSTSGTQSQMAIVIEEGDLYRVILNNPMPLTERMNALYITMAQ